MKKDIFQKFILLLLCGAFLAGCGSKPKGDIALKQETKPIFIAEGVRSVDVVKQGKEILNITYEPQDYEESFEYWNMKVPYGDEVVVNTEEALKLYQQLVMIDMQMEALAVEPKTNFHEPLGKIKVDFCQTSEEERNAATMGEAIERENSPSFKATPDRTATLLIGENDGKGNYYVAYEGDEKNVYLLNERMVDVVLDIKPFDYILKVSAIANKETVKKITIKADGKTYKIAEKDLDEQVYQTLYNDIFSVFIVAEITEENKIGKEALLEIALKRNVKGASDLKIEYRPWDDEKCAVVVNGKIHFLVNKADVEVLKAKIKEIFEK